MNKELYEEMKEDMYQNMVRSLVLMGRSYKARPMNPRMLMIKMLRVRRSNTINSKSNRNKSL
eukprot:9590088-Prorocentrum_lima.AAC.1